ncbi:MAG: putative Mg2+ transporter-C (MgtC) family protein [Planctomycetota bacterium]|jgi:putative Mg2+ transporter-C (MgtC) family protein
MPTSFPIPDFQSLNLYPLLYALVLGGVIGLEREWHGRPAGLRTHVLVCMSATMLIMISQRTGAANFTGDGRLVFDPNRMGAGIVTGIGFLGAATVLRSGDLLRGLTTAACIWFVAGLGIVLGNQNYALATVATGIVLLVLTVLNRLTGLIHPIIYRRLIVMHCHADSQATADAVSKLLKDEGCRVLDIASGTDSVDSCHELVFYVSLKSGLQSPRVTQAVAGLTDVTSARWKLISNPN